jgi:peptide/nickel transport system ATP-binding protein
MLLSIQDLKVAFRMGRVDGVEQRAEAVKGVSFDIPENTTVALVGESGSGKSVTAMSIVNLLPDNAERSGQVLWQGRDLLRASLPELQRLRGREIACVFQDPMTSLNPVFTVGDQLVEPLARHLGLSRRAAIDRAQALMAEVGIPEPRRRLASYPHELSGGQQQRVMIASRPSSASPSVRSSASSVGRRSLSVPTSAISAWAVASSRWALAAPNPMSPAHSATTR